MTSLREGAVRCLDPHGFHWMRYVEWGDRDNPRVVLCVHGLMRNGRDFDFLAQGLAADFRVVCPDIVGRGRSDWLRDPADYTYPVYCQDLVALLAAVGAPQVDWVGTSMGGILGMILAGLPGSPVRRLVVNDVGSLVPRAALERIGGYVGQSPTFASLEEFEIAMRLVSPFGPLTEAQWRHLALHSAEAHEGRWRLRSDPGIGRNFHAVEPADLDLRPYWNAVPGPVLVIRGAESDLLLPETFEEMKRRPATATFVVPDTGHAPMLMDPPQIEAVRGFLLA